MTKPKRRQGRVRLTADEASIVLSTVADMPGSGCPVCFAFGHVIGYRRGCKSLAYSVFWDRDVDEVAACIEVPTKRGRRG